MMDPAEFIRTIYLGDRACKSIIVDGWAEEVRVQVDCISRVRGETWNYYREENLVDGFIVFEGVNRIDWDPGGKIPNDAFQSLTVESCEEREGKYVFSLEISSWDHEAKAFFPVHLKIYANAIALEAKEGHVRIRS